MVNTKGLILAAGAGTRLDPLTRKVPKPLIPVANRPIIAHILNLLHRHHVKECIANLHHLADQIPAYFSDSSNHEHLTYKYEPQLTGDAGGMRTCKAFLQDSTFVVIMGDLLTDMDLSMVIREHKAKGALATIALKQVDEVERFGLAVLDRSGQITQFQEKPKKENALSNLASTGFYVFEPEIFNYVPSQGPYGFGKDLFPKLIELGLPVLGVEVNCYWSDVGTIAQYLRSSFDVLEGKINIDIAGQPQTFGWVGENSSIGPNCKVDGKLLLGENSYVEANVSFSGNVIIGDNSRIGAGSKIDNAIIWQDSYIEPGTSIASAIICQDESEANAQVEEADRSA
jgi:mannose-1-phosphate guanylyltransferase